MHPYKDELLQVYGGKTGEYSSLIMWFDIEMGLGYLEFVWIECLLKVGSGVQYRVLCCYWGKIKKSRDIHEIL